jgi:hypothetical protein
VYTSDPVKQANIIAQNILDLFVSCFDVDELWSCELGERRVAPEGWRLVDSVYCCDEFADAISAELRAFGVREDLCTLK